MSASYRTSFSGLSEKYGDMFVSPGDLTSLYDENRLRRLASSVSLLEEAVEWEDILLVPAPPSPIGNIGIYRMFPELFSNLPEEWGKEMVTGPDPCLYRDQTSDSLWYLFRVPKESYAIPYEDQKGLRHNPETVPNLAEVLWMLEIFARAGKDFPVEVGHILRTSSRSSDGGVLSVLRWDNHLVVSDYLGCDADTKAALPFLKSV